MEQNNEIDAFKMIMEDQEGDKDINLKGGDSPEGEKGAHGSNDSSEGEKEDGKKTEPSMEFIELDADLQPKSTDNPGEQPKGSPTDSLAANEDPANNEPDPNNPEQFLGQRLKSMLDGRFDGETVEEQLGFIEGILDNQEDVLSVRDELSRQKQLNQELQDRLKNQDPDMISAMEFKKETGISDINTFNALKNVDIESINAKQAIEMVSKIKHPNLSSEDLQFKMSRKYKLGDDYDEADQRLGEIEMKEEAYEAKNYLKELKGKIKTPEIDFDSQARESELAEEFENLKESWDNAVENSFAKVQNPKFNIDENVSVEMSIEPSEIEWMKDIAWEYAVENKLDPTDKDAYPEIASYVQQMYIAENFNRIAKAIYVQAQNDKELKNKQELANPSAMSADKPDQPSDSKKKDMSDEAFQFAMRNM